MTTIAEDFCLQCMECDEQCTNEYTNECSNECSNECTNECTNECNELCCLTDSISDAVSYSRKEKEHINDLAKDLFNKTNFVKLKKYLNKLSILNFRSKRKIRAIFIELQNIRNIANASQQGYMDYNIAAHANNGTQNLSLELLRNQINNSRSKLLSKQAEGKTKKRERKKEPKKKKLETKKKIDFKKLRKHITQRLKPRFKSRFKFGRSKTRNKK